MTVRPLYRVRASDVHIISTIVYRVQHDQVFMLAIAIADWVPQHIDLP